MKPIFYLLLIFLASNFSYAQKRDTIFINVKNIKVNQLNEGKSIYLVYFRKQKDATRTMTQFWTREVKRKTESGKKLIEIYQFWEDKDSIVHTSKSLFDATTFKPLLQESWWNRNGKKSKSIYDYEKKQINIDGTNSLNDTSTKGKEMSRGFLKATDIYHLNWHTDLEVFSILPLSLHKTYAIPFYEAGYKEPENIYYTVTGEEKLKGYNSQEIACWILTHETPGNKEKFWISKKTKEVLKMEQEVNGKMYRHKIKLGFSD